MTIEKFKFWKWHLGADTIVARFDSGLMQNKEKFKFFFIVAVVFAIALEVNAWFAAEFNITYSNLDKISMLLYLLFNIAGLIYLYQKHTENTSFIEKYFVVLVASFVAVVLFVALPASVALYFVVSLFIDLPESSSWLDVIIESFVTVLIYAKLGTYFK